MNAEHFETISHGEWCDRAIAGTMSENMKHFPGTVISAKRPRGAEKWCDGWLVNVAHSCRYNGWTIIGGEWYAGVIVGEPVVPDGFELCSIHVGSNLMACPPTRKMLLRKKA